MDATSGVVHIRRATIADVDFREVAFSRFTPDGCVFVNCDFGGIVFDRKWQPLFSSPVQSVFRDCRFDGADLVKADPGQTRFERCSFVDARIEKWQSACAEFVDCVFAGPLVQCRFYGRPWGLGAQHIDPKRATNEFRGNDFRRSDLVETVFVHGIRMAEQTWPDTPEWIHLDRFHQRAQRVRAAVIRWKDPELRQAALSMLVRLQTLYGEQTELVCRRFDPRAKIPAEAQARVWEVFAAAL
ncbi:MAG TPA: pentapeptide repeat-containing protein [Candidatus Limnocylindria bacterium]